MDNTEKAINAVADTVANMIDTAWDFIKMVLLLGLLGGAGFLIYSVFAGIPQ